MYGRIAIVVVGLCLQGTALASEPWLAPGDVRVRHDIELLVDAGIINLPMSAWPIAVSDLAAALDKARVERTAAQVAAFERLRRICSPGSHSLGVEVRGALHPTTLRTFADDAREEGELTGYAAGFLAEHWGARLELTAAANPDDGHPVRLDGSYLAGKFGNWIVTLGAQDRWWGSGWEGSLLLSSNARPVPAIALDRAVSRPFETKWLSWIGPWRLTTFMGYMEGGRHDYNHPLLFGMRISARPVEGLEISVERTAQWCGEGRPCGWSDFWNLFTGHDNAGENVAGTNEPGNQLASWDLRWASPITSAPYAIYWQHTGETIDNHIPRPYRAFDIVGVEIWGMSAVDGTSWRAGIESAGTLCGGTENGETLWDCAYNHHIYTDGYRYYGRPLGHAMDGDGQMYSARLIRVDPRGSTLTGIVRYTQVNRGGSVPAPSNLNSVAPGPENWWSVDFTYRYPLASGWVEAGVGGDYRDRIWNNTEATLPRASLTWRHDFR